MRLLYWLYASRLRREIKSHPVPRHVGIILDGNRRYARKQHLAHPRIAYDLGAEKLNDVLAWCFELGIRAVTLWVCSINNLSRSRAELSDILAAIEAKIGALARDPVVRSCGVRVRAVGRLDLLPRSTMTVLREAERATANCDVLMLTIAIAYGGREEIADAVRELVRDKVRHGADLEAVVEGITPLAIDDYLYTAGLPDLDLIIRTSGEIRLSGFLLWQSANSELYFSDVNWPEFRRIDFLRAIRSFQQRSRRFGQ